MKKLNWSIQLLLFFSFSFAILSCNSAKNAQQDEFPMIITLEDGLTGKYFSNNYADFSPMNIKKSNRTLNQYSLTFKTTKKNHATLLKKIESDSKIMEADVSSSSEIKIQSGTNDKHSKVSPIKSNN